MYEVMSPYMFNLNYVLQRMLLSLIKQQNSVGSLEKKMVST